VHLRILVTAAALAALTASALAAGKPVVNPHVGTDTSVDYTTIDRIIASVVKKGMTDEQKVLAVFHAMRRMWVHGPTPGRLAYDFHKVIHSIGTGACLTMTTPLHVVYDRMGYKSRSWVHNTHHMMEVFYGGDWHCLDPHMSFYCYDRSKPRKIASIAQLRADPTLAHDAVKEGRAGQGYLLCGDKPKWFAAQKNNPRDRWTLERGGRWPKMKIAEPFGQITLRRGETYVRTWRPGKYWYKKSWGPGRGPYHTCGPADRKDTANWPLYEPHAWKGAYRCWAAGQLIYKPDLATDHYLDAVADSKNIKAAGGALAQADAGKPGEIVWSVQCPYVLTAGELKMAAPAKGKLAAAVSIDDGKTWKDLTLAKADGSVAGTFVDEVNGSWAGCRVRVRLTGGATLAKMALTSHFQVNRFSLPNFVPGANVVSVVADAYGSPLTVTYKWAEGPKWKTPKTVSKTFAKNGKFTVEAAGPKWPRMESLTLSVAP